MRRNTAAEAGSLEVTPPHSHPGLTFHLAVVLQLGLEVEGCGVPVLLRHLVLAVRRSGLHGVAGAGRGAATVSRHEGGGGGQQQGGGEGGEEGGHGGAEQRTGDPGPGHHLLYTLGHAQLSTMTMGNILNILNYPHFLIAKGAKVQKESQSPKLKFFLSSLHSSQKIS